MARVLTAVFERPAEFLAQEGHLKAGGFFLPAPEPPPQPMEEVQLEVMTPAAETFAFAARVVQISPAGISLAFADAADAKAKLAPQFDLVRGVPADATMEAMRVAWGDLDEEKPEAEPADEESKALYDKIREMPANEKMKLASHGDRAARLLLMKDTNKSLHVFVLKNPGITLDEVIYMAGFRQTNPEALSMIAGNRDWTQNSRVVSALVRNPKTPSTVAVRLLDKLPMSEVRRLAKSPDTPRAVAQAAKKKAIGS